MASDSISEIELSYFAALIEALRLIDEKNEELGLNQEISPRAKRYLRQQGDISVALQQFVEKRGEEIHTAFLLGGGNRLETPMKNEKLIDSEKCLNARCESGKPIRNRGLCHPCYQLARRLVETKQTTWEDLEKRGKVRPPNARKKKAAARIEWFLS